jgi:hypothetical protein
MVEVRVLVCTGGLPVLLQMLLRVLEVVRAGWVAPSYRALLEVTLEDITSAKSVLAKMALVWSLTSVCGMLEAELDCMGDRLTSQQMTLEMLEVQVRLVAVRALVLALGVLGSSGGSLACGGRGPSGMRGQDSATTLLTDDVNRFGLLVGKHGRVGVHGRVSQSSHARRAA